MRYSYFDDAHRGYVTDRVDAPVSCSNSIGLKDMYGVFDHTAGGCLKKTVELAPGSVCSIEVTMG